MLATYKRRMRNSNLAPVVQSWTALSVGQINIQWISIRETNRAIHWIVIYPVDSAIQRLNNRGLEIRFVGSSSRPQLS